MDELKAALIFIEENGGLPFPWAVNFDKPEPFGFKVNKRRFGEYHKMFPIWLNSLGAHLEENMDGCYGISCDKHWESGSKRMRLVSSRYLVDKEDNGIREYTDNLSKAKGIVILYAQALKLYKEYN